MKFLIDENLSPRVAAWLTEKGHDALHVLGVGLGGRPDFEIVAFAVQHERVIVTQDADFDQAGSVQVLRLAIGNASTATLLAWLEAQLDQVILRLARNEPLIVLS